MNTNIKILKSLLLKYIQILNKQAVFVFLDHQKDKRIVKETLPAILLYNKIRNWKLNQMKQRTATMLLKQMKQFFSRHVEQ